MPALYHAFGRSENGQLVKTGGEVYNTLYGRRRTGWKDEGQEGRNPLESGSEQEIAAEVSPKTGGKIGGQGMGSRQISSRRARWTRVAVVLSALLLVLAVAVPPHSLLQKADLVGYAVCHQIVERSFVLGGRPLPLCARCTGTFLGALEGLAAAVLRRRLRATRMPPVPVLGLLVGFTALWAFDGLNSYLTLFPGAPHLYEPRNWLRLTTGMLNGLVLINVTLPVFTYTLWRDVTDERVIRNVRELVTMLPVVAVLIVVVQAEIGWLLYPLAIISSLGVVVLLVLINSMIGAVVLGREGHARSWLQAAVPLSLGAALSLVELAGMILLRSTLATTFGITF
jgi:uncharacterized membrane protein